MLVLEARSRLGGRATAFHDRETGELVDNGQHVLLGCYSETFAFLDEIGARDHVTLPAAARRHDDRPRGPPQPARVPGAAAAAPSPRRRVRLGRAGLERSAVGAADGGRRSAGAPGADAGRARAIAASPGETVENWLIRNGQTARLREMLWDPLALAALNQPPAHAAAPSFARVLAEMFGPDPRAAAIALPTRPLHEMYAEPARAYIERHGGTVRTGAPATVRSRAARACRSSSSGDERWRPDAVIAAVPWFALPTLFDGDIGAARPS